jgi:uncharacterized protein (DUF433 family)
LVTREIHTERIIQDPNILAGKPVVRGTRIPVTLILEYLANNPDFEALVADYPRLTMDDIKACLGFARGLVEQGGIKGRGKRLPSAGSGG